jgi:hypothetical protein
MSNGNGDGKDELIASLKESVEYMETMYNKLKKAKDFVNDARNHTCLTHRHLQCACCEIWKALNQ